MSTNTASDTTLSVTTNTVVVGNICIQYRTQPVLTCQYLLALASTWKGTKGAFVKEAERLTGARQAHVYRILKLRKFIQDFGDLPPEQQPSWKALRLLVQELNRAQILDAWITAVWANSGTSKEMPGATLRQSIQAVRAQAKAKL